MLTENTVVTLSLLKRGVTLKVVPKAPPRFDKLSVT